MKKNILSHLFLICSLLITITTARAQYVSIPDTNFGNWLYANGYDSCLTGSSTSGWHLDTTCNKLPLAVAVDCSNQNISDLTGLRYFKHLRSLYCDRNNLTALPALPTLLTYINCSFNQLASLPAMPDSLVTLECANNSLASLLPALGQLPATITQINCSNNSLTSLPVTLPASLQGLICATNSLSSLPMLPSGLLSLDCSYNQITALPSLPSVLFNLLCEHNQLSSLPTLDDSLRFLNCANNSLTTTPAMPPLLITLDCSANILTSLGPLDAQLRTLSCENNLLTSLPALTDTMTGLNCSYNNISSLAGLPYDLTDLDCSHNLNLACLPIVHQTQMNSFYIDSTEIQCKPDSFGAFAFDINPDSLPLCTAASGCPYTTTSGIMPLSNINTLSLYPNPNNGSFTLATGNSQQTTNFYTITDMMGNIISHEAITSSSQIISLSGAADGVYMLTVKDAQPLRFVILR